MTGRRRWLFGAVGLCAVLSAATASADVDCAFAPVNDARAVGTYLARWVAENHLGRLEKWDLSLDRDRASLQLWVTPGALVVSFRLSSSCQPEAVRVTTSGGYGAAPPRAAALARLADRLPVPKVRPYSSSPSLLDRLFATPASWRVLVTASLFVLVVMLFRAGVQRVLLRATRSDTLARRSGRPAPVFTRGVILRGKALGARLGRTCARAPQFLWAPLRALAQWRRGALQMPLTVLVSVGLAFWIPITTYVAGTPDWGYFNSLSLLVRSSVLRYHALPLHDPWCGGGLNLLANPQNRIFSPLSLLDVALPPYWANLTGLALYAALGMWGMYEVLRLRGLPRPASLLAAFVFIQSTWFGAHFAEGHVAFGALQLLPWVLWCWMRIEHPVAVVVLGALFAHFLLDGAIYAFVYSLLLVISATAAGLTPTRSVVGAVRRRPGAIALSVAGAVLASMPKTLPSLVDPKWRGPEFDTFAMPLQTLLRSFFWPTTQRDLKTPGTPYLFHEFACHLGVAAFAWVAIELIRHGELRRQLIRPLLVCAFWLWIAAGWWPALNPWRLYELVPLLNNAHVQSRLLLLMFVFYVFVAGHVFAQLDFANRKVGLLVAWVVIEAVLYRNVLFDEVGADPSLAGLIRKSTIDETVEDLPKPELYFAGNKASRECYEPAHPPPTDIVASSDPTYRGEAHAEGEGSAARIVSYVPGRITLDVSGLSETMVRVNTRDLGHWAVVDDSDAPSVAKIVSHKHEPLALSVASGRHTIRLEFRPTYLPWIAASWIVGWAILIGLGMRYGRRATIAQQAPTGSG